MNSAASRAGGPSLALLALPVIVLAALLVPAARVDGAEPSPAEAAPRKLGILVFPGVQVIDFTGPYEVLSAAHSRNRPLFDVVTVGLTSEMFRAGSPEKGIRMLPDVSIDDCPKLDVLVIPGGEVGAVEDSPRAMEWVAKAVREAECVMSVCNGAFVLAKGGHLKDQSATTFYYFIDQLKQDEPTCTPVHDQRFVDNGKIITTAGLSSGIDGALHLVERYGSRFDAQQCALGLEYNWQPELNWARGNLADRHYISMVGRGFDFPPGSVTDWTTVENGGTPDQWTRAWTFKSTLQETELLQVFEPKLAASWTRTSGGEGMSTWTFKDDRGRTWMATLTLAAGAANTWRATIYLAQDR